MVTKMFLSLLCPVFIIKKMYSQISSILAGKSISSHRIENRRLFNGRVFIHSYERQNIDLFDSTPEDARRLPGLSNAAIDY